MSVRPFAASICCLVLGLLAPQIAHASAEQQDRPWEVEAYVGGIRSSHPEGGVATLPPPGETFVNFFGLPSRTVSSWMFGDGAAMLSQVNTMRPFGGRAAVSPLDPVLTSASIRRGNGVAAGVRVRRAINARFGAELSIDYGSGRFAFTPAARDQFEATRASVVAALPQVILVSRTTATSEVSLNELGGPLVIATGALNINLKRTGRVIPYVVAGAGVVSHTGGAPSASVHTTYTIQPPTPPPGFLPLMPLVESDRVTVRYDVSRHTPAFTVGGGLKYALASRWALRIDARAQFTTSRLMIAMDVNPQTNSGSGGGTAAVATGTNPSLQFGNVPGGSGTLSGPVLDDFVTFESRTRQRHFSVTTGLAWRF